MRYASRTVTTCIAAKALAPGAITEGEGEFHSALVLCMDTLGSTGYSSAENVSKHWFLPHGFVALIAGTVHVAREFSAIVSGQLKDCELTPTEILSRLRESMTILKHRLADEHLGAAVGMSYSAFQEYGASALPRDLYRTLAWEVRNQIVDVELIVAGFIKHQSVLVKLSSGKAMICDHFATIGSGGFLADASLLQREHSELCHFNLAVYRVYEAKRLSERAPGVGPSTSIMVLHDSIDKTELDLFHQERLPLLDQEIKRFGPKRLGVSDLKPLPKDAYFRLPTPPPEWEPDEDETET